MCACNSSTEEEELGKAWSLWADSLVEPVAARFSERPGLKIKMEKIEEDIQH